MNDNNTKNGENADKRRSTQQSIYEATSNIKVEFGEENSINKASLNSVHVKFENENTSDTLTFNEEHYENCYELKVSILQYIISSYITNNISVITKCFYAILFIIYNAFFIYANIYNYKYHNLNNVKSLNVMTGLTYGLAIFSVILRYYGNHLGEFLKKISKTFCYSPKVKNVIHISLYALILILILLFLILDVGLDSLRLRSAIGIIILVKLVYITSTNATRVKWKPVVWGISLQVIFCFSILRWKKGYEFFELFCKKTVLFLSYANNGSKFVFGEKGIIDHPMAMEIFPIIIYFSALISILYYWGIMQKIIQGIAWFMQYTMGTTAIETLNAATNIFVGMAESCVVLTPFLPYLTKSELHAVMTGGFASVAGSYIALLINIGIDSVHIMSAAMMSAPASLAIAKLSYPETEKSSTKSANDIYLESFPANNFLEAAITGAVDALKIIGGITGSLIAILGLLSFIYSLLSWFGGLIGHPEFSFELLCSYIFFPLAILMGVPVKDSRKIGEIIGKKIFVDELLAFQEIVELINHGDISERSAMIGIYSCCGFGSISAIGIYVGAMVAVAPSMKADILEIAPRAMINGNIAGFMTACIAGVLYNENSFHSNSSSVNIHQGGQSICPCCSCLGNYSRIWFNFIEKWTDNNSLIEHDFSVSF